MYKRQVEHEIARRGAEAGCEDARKAAHAFVENSAGRFVGVDIRSFTGATTGVDFKKIAGVVVVERVRDGEAQGVQRGDGVYAIAGKVVFESKYTRDLVLLIQTAERPLEIIFLKKGPSIKKQRIE